MSKQKHTQICGFILIAVIAIFSSYMNFNLHAHFNINGRLVVHGHPVKTNSENHNIPNHNHSKADLLAIDMKGNESAHSFSHFFSHNMFIQEEDHIRLFEISIDKKDFKKSTPLRAPPSS